ncbi:hypothetical protein VTK26DRAFT_5524 [Humicola hyalothermophila]
MEDAAIRDPIAELITDYNELNSCVIEELHEEPSPLEFMRYVAKNTPFVVRGAASDWQATRTWTVDYLKSVLGDEPVNVAVTPAGNADAPTPFTDPSTGASTLVFAKPHEESQPFSAFLTTLTTQELSSSPSPSSSALITTSPEEAEAEGQEILYAQTQNDNLRHEYRALFSAVPPTIPWARIALARPPEAVNLWIGNSRSVTALHKDNYENVYVQVAGRKHFVLLPPHCQPCVNERLLRGAVYVRRAPASSSSSSSSSGSGDGGDGDEETDGRKAKLELVVEEGEQENEVPFAIWDPDKPGENETAYSKLAKPMRVTLNPGDMLYLPCMWYHKVSQSCSPEGVCIAVNYWYDMDFNGPLYPLTTFVRSVSNKQK